MQTSQARALDFRAPEYQDCLYATYRLLRDEHPVYFDESRGAFLITRYDDVRQALRDTAVFHNSGTSQDIVEQMQSTDGALHKDLRGKVRKQFSQALVEALEPGLQTIVDSLFDELLDNASDKPLDILNGVINEIPRRFMSDFLGFPEHLRAVWYALGEPMVGFDPRNPVEAPETLYQKMIDVVDEAIDWKRQHPSEDVFGWLVRAESAGEFTAREVHLLVRNLGFAALDTTINLLANGTALLANNPDQRQRLIADAALMEAATNEMLRCEAPTQSLPRRVHVDTELHGVKIAAGQEVRLVYGAANRDERHYADPDRFDLSRASHDHLAFGYGVHKCIGQYLAKMEARIYFSALLQRLPEYQVADSSWLISPWARAYANLSISPS